MWEFRIAVATDPVTGRSVQRSFTVRGSRRQVEAAYADLAAECPGVAAAPFVTVGEILARWIEADHE